MSCVKLVSQPPNPAQNSPAFAALFASLRRPSPPWRKHRYARAAAGCSRGVSERYGEQVEAAERVGASCVGHCSDQRRGSNSNKTRCQRRPGEVQKLQPDSHSRGRYKNASLDFVHLDQAFGLCRATCFRLHWAVRPVVTAR